MSFLSFLQTAITIASATIAYLVIDPKKHPAVRPVIITLIIFIFFVSFYQLSLPRNAEAAEVKELSKLVDALKQEIAKNEQDRDAATRSPIMYYSHREPLVLPVAHAPTPTTTPPPAPTSTTQSASAPQPDCKSPTAQAITKMIARCGTQRVCPVDLPLASMDEYQAMMLHLPTAALFFPSGNASNPTNDVAKFDSIVRAASKDTTFIVVSRASKTGKAARNKEISRQRAIFAKDRISQSVSNPVALSSYAEERLYLNVEDADAFGIDPRDYNGTEQRLNQSVFVFRFDCPLNSGSAP